jgi:hypothetical protein
VSYTPAPDTPMKDSEVVRAEQMLRAGEITQSDLAWLLALEDDEEDRPCPRGFKNWRHFNAFLWHKEQKAKGRVVKKRKRAI